MPNSLSKIDKMNFCLAMLDNDHGIVESAYNTLIDTGLMPCEIVKYVDAVNDRFYISEENANLIKSLISELGEENE
ncbi:MAG: hypothetical protein CMQ41_07880 [Gammaproteobacteria bacterium]|nr:hypothetical protein [Gammaproteobacteria bacterium]